MYAHVYVLYGVANAMALTSEKRMRKQFLVPPATVKRLERTAAARGTSASEIVRQAINSYDVQDGEAMESSDLMELVATRLKEAIAFTRGAKRTVNKTHRTLEAAEDWWRGGRMSCLTSSNLPTK